MIFFFILVMLTLFYLQAACAIKEVVSVAAGEGAHIICGDFNSESSSPAYQLVLDGSLSESSIQQLQALENLTVLDTKVTSVSHSFYSTYRLFIIHLYFVCVCVFVGRILINLVEVLVWIIMPINGHVWLSINTTMECNKVPLRFLRMRMDVTFNFRSWKILTAYIHFKSDWLYGHFIKISLYISDKIVIMLLFFIQKYSMLTFRV